MESEKNFNKYKKTLSDASTTIKDSCTSEQNEFPESLYMSFKGENFLEEEIFKTKDLKYKKFYSEPLKETAHQRTKSTDTNLMKKNENENIIDGKIHSEKYIRADKSKKLFSEEAINKMLKYVTKKKNGKILSLKERIDLFRKIICRCHNERYFNKQTIITVWNAVIQN